MDKQKQDLQEQIIWGNRMRKKSRSHLYCQKYNQKKKRNHLILLICILVSTMGWSQAQDRVLLRDSIAIDGMQRSFEYFAPQSLKTAPR